MILKKPYAFLIKHFRLVHLLLLLPMLYIIIKSNSIVDFFNTYIANNYTATNIIISSLTSNYINILMYFAIIIILVVLVTINLLFQKKEKPTKFYSISIIYYIAIFILLTIYYSVFKMIETDTLDNVLARLIRDLSYIVYYSQYIFFIYTLIRGIGFNIKQFNFKSDIEDLEISSEDSEEFEFMVGLDTYKTKRTIRRFFRELKYYYLENKFIFTIVFVIIAISLTTTLYVNRDVHQVYKESDVISFDYFNVSVKDSYISSLSLNGDVLKEGKAYVILQLSIKNRNYQDKNFNYENFKLIVNKQAFAPNISAGNYFTDFGNPFNGSPIKGDYEGNYILVYEIDQALISAKFSLVAYSSSQEKKITLKPIVLNNNVITNNINMGTNINIEDTNLKKTTASISAYEITNRYVYTYQYCTSTDNCYTSKDAVAINYASESNKTLLVLDYKIALDDESPYMYSNKTYKNFFEDFMKIKYTINDKDYYTNVSIANPNAFNDKLIIKVPSNITNADSIEAIITVRNVSYSIKLK